jgi:NTP pyrophosphatase (non-canonical NTP hydrolase)
VDDKEILDIQNRGIKINGEDWYLNKLAEECAELNLAILHYFNKNKPIKNVLKEAADVLIAIEYLFLFYGKDKIFWFKKLKYNRIKLKVEEQESTILQERKKRK